MQIAETHTAYQCDGCEAVYRESDEANRCCPDAEEREVFECSKCEEEFLTREEAMKCCEGEREYHVTCEQCGDSYAFQDAEGGEEALKKALECCIEPDKIDRWVCTVDGIIYYSEEAARDCCESYTEVIEYECPVCVYRNSDKGKAMMHCQKT
jgi:hypothetical protein